MFRSLIYLLQGNLYTSLFWTFHFICETNDPPPGTSISAFWRDVTTIIMLIYLTDSSDGLHVFALHYRPSFISILYFAVHQQPAPILLGCASLSFSQLETLLFLPIFIVFSDEYPLKICYNVTSQNIWSTRTGSSSVKSLRPWLRTGYWCRWHLVKNFSTPYHQLQTNFRQLYRLSCKQFPLPGQSTGGDCMGRRCHRSRFRCTRGLHLWRYHVCIPLSVNGIRC